MVVKLRLARFGNTHRPFYRLMAADIDAPRDGKFLEQLGHYDPLSARDENGQKRISLKADRIKYWLSVGAKPTETVERMLLRAGLITPPPTAALPRKGGPRQMLVVDPVSGGVLTEEKPNSASLVEDPNV